MTSLVFGAQASITSIFLLVMTVLAIGTLINSLLYSAESYVAADKWSKPAWTIILALCVVLLLFPVGGLILGIAAIVFPLVYLLDVRPALAGLTRR